MARFDMSGLQPVIDEMRKLGEESGEAAEAVLMAGAEGVKRAWRMAAEKHGHVAFGDMLNSIGYARHPQKTGDALSIDIYPQGKDRKGVRNAEKAFVLHYGTSKLAGSHWVDTADAYSEREAIPAMVETWESFIETGKIKRG